VPNFLDYTLDNGMQNWTSVYCLYVETNYMMYMYGKLFLCYHNVPKISWTTKFV